MADMCQIEASGNAELEADTAAAPVKKSVSVRLRRARFVVAASVVAMATFAAQGTATADSPVDVATGVVTKTQMMNQLAQIITPAPPANTSMSGWPAANGTPRPFTTAQKDRLEAWVSGFGIRTAWRDSLADKCTEGAQCGWAGFLDSDGYAPVLYTGTTGSVATRTLATTTTISKSTTSSSGWKFSLNLGGSAGAGTGAVTVDYNTVTENNITTGSGMTETVTWQPNYVTSYPQLRLNGAAYTGYAVVRWWSSGIGINPDPYGWNYAVKTVRTLIMCPGQDSPATWFLVKP
ncbi:hypothetical protein [Streptomyces sp. NPDC005533]|uniref:hypothetical protein n=1 Tax=Streptomyces sp. NPDC005533 TaxID=3364723 RepID=UPI0036AADB45